MSDAEKIQRNIDALRLAKQLRTSGAAPSRQEREILQGYIGWGGLDSVFDETREVHRASREQLKDILDEQEYASARRSMLTSFYTPPEIVEATWSALKEAGLSGGSVLEPGCGIGDFLAGAPNGVQTVGVELDPSSALIASALYPDAQIRREGFEETDFNNATFTATIGNVPFSQSVPNDTVHNPHNNLTLHDYFIAKSAHLTAAGGYVAVITSTFTADKEGQAREAITDNADLISAVRLPGGRNGVFATNAGTEVSTDLLIFRVREDGQEPTEDTRRFVDTELVEVDGEQVRINSYFAAHPDHILADFGVGSGRFGMEKKFTRTDTDNAALAEKITTVIGADVATAVESGRGLTASPTGTQAEALEATGLVEQAASALPEVVGTMRYTMVGDDFSFEQYLPAEDAHEEATWQPVAPRPKKLAPEWAHLIDLRDTLRNLQLASEANDVAQAESLRVKLTDDYDNYVATYGFINRHTYAAPRTPTESQATKKLDELVAEWRQDNAIGDRPYEGELPDGVVEELREIATSPIENRTPVRPHLRGAISNDPFMNTVIALEQYSEETGRAKKGSWFTTNPLRMVTERTHADTLADAVAIAETSRRGLTSQNLADLRGQPIDEVEAELEATGLAFRDHDDPEIWEAPVAYLSGNVRGKLQEAQKLLDSGDDRYQVNVDALTAAQPEKITSGITMNIGATWIPVDIYKDFIVEKTKMPSWVANNLEIRHVGDEWILTKEPKNWYGQDDAAIQWGLVAKHNSSERYNFSMSGKAGTLPHCGVATRYQSRNMVISGEQMIVNAMNLAAPKIRWSSTLAEESPEYTGVHMAATQFAGRKVAEIETEFSEWISADPERHARLVNAYNEAFNSIVAPKYDGAGREMPGLGSTFNPYPYQLNAVERITHEPAVLLNHVVGAGKTGTMIMGAMELKRLGKINKPWLIVPNHLVEQIAREAKQWYPAANVLSGASARGSAKRRQLFLAQSASMDWDLVVVPESVFTATGLRSDSINAYRDAQLIGLRQELDEMRADGALQISIKDVENKIIAFEKRLTAQANKAEKNTGLNFEDTGCDYIIADEAHNYKNLLRPSRVADLTGTASNKATDMDMKLDYLRSQKTPGSPVTTFATGTPIANNIAELWVMQQYLRPDLLAEAHISGINAWGANFTKSITDVDFTAGGRIVEKSRVSSYVNVADLAMACTPFMDHVGSDQITADLPQMRGGAPTVVEFDAGIDVQDFIADLPWREDHFAHDLVKIDNPLKVINDGKNVTLDPRMAGLEATPGIGRINTVCDNIIAEWEANRDNVYTDQLGETSPNPGGLQIVFCDKGVPNKQGRFSIYDAIRDDLVARGMDRDRIRFIHEWDTRKLQLFDDCNNGLVDVIIGNTPKMGTGANIQSRAVALHNVDVPWRPADLEQQRGRIIRQGNQNPEVGIYEYVGKGTYDGYSWGVLYRKAKFIEQFNKADPTLREAESLESEGSDAMAHNRALATGNDDFILQMKLRREIDTLKSRKAEHEALVASNSEELAELTRRKPSMDRLVARHNDVAESVKDWIQTQPETPSNSEDDDTQTPDAHREWEFAQQKFTTRKEAAQAASEVLRTIVSERNVQAQTIGSIAGVGITARYSSEYSGVILQTDPPSSSFGKTIGSEDILTAPAGVDELPDNVRKAQSKALLLMENSVRSLPKQREKILAQAAEMDKALQRLETTRDGGFTQEDELNQLIIEEREVNKRLVEFEKSDAEKQRQLEQKRRMLNKDRVPGWTLALNPTTHMRESGIVEHPDSAEERRQLMEERQAEQSAQPPKTVDPEPQFKVAQLPKGLFPTSLKESLKNMRDKPASEHQHDSGYVKPGTPSPSTGPDNDTGPGL